VVTRPKTAVKTDPELMDLLKDGCGAKADRDFFLALATCNTIVPIVTDDAGERLVEYQGESPDEQALVYAAAAYGHTLLERTSGHIIIDVFGDRQRCVRTRHFTPRTSSFQCVLCFSVGSRLHYCLLTIPILRQRL
jgi:phospholipid-transporting ATPase